MTGATITIRTDVDLAGKVAALASAMDRSCNHVIEDAFRQYVGEQEWQVEGIKAAIASLDRGEGIPHEQVMAEVERFFKRERY